MSDKEQLPVIRLELSSGVFRIKTGEAVYEITVSPAGGVTKVIEKIVEKEVPVPVPEPAPAPAPPAPPPQEEPAPAETADEKPAAAQQPVTDATETSSAEQDFAFYKEISEEMLNEIGKLARDLSLSIKEMPSADELQHVDIQKAGVDLESAKGLLGDIVKMTEKATMEIMDLSESIQDDCETIQNNLAEVKKLDFVGNNVPSSGSAPDEALVKAVDDMLEHNRQLKDLLESVPVPEPAEQPAAEQPDEPETKVVTVYSFDFDVLFQTLYELCTNEAVKKHIKAMREAREDEFDKEAVMQALSEMAPEVDVEDNFFNFSLTELLKTLFKNTDSDKNRQILKKMNQSAASIFLDQVLPIEGTVEEKEVAVESTPAAGQPSGDARDGPLDEARGIVARNIELLEKLSRRLRETAPAEQDSSEYSMVRKDDHDKLIAAMESSDAVIQKIVASIRQILESLSFQDLSGQRIIKIADTLTNVQVQLLSILVSFGVKLKGKQECSGDFDDTVGDTVHSMMGRIAEENWEQEGQKSPLDQNEVDKLLAELGF